MTAVPQELAERLAGAAGWRLLALLLSRPRAGWAGEAEALAAEVRDEPLREAVRAAPGAGEGAYHALLGPGGPASPREAAHAGFADPGRILADLAARYEAFGFAPSGEEPDDHVAVECDFVSWLFLKEAHALAAGLAGAAEVTREAREAFLRDHAAVAGRRLAEKLPPGAPRYLALAASALAARLPELPPPPAGCPAGDPLEGGCPAAAGGGCPA